MRVHAGRDIHVSSTLREQGIWEPYETALLRSCLQPGYRVLDVGANIGYFTLLCAACVGDSGHVYAFEPEPRNFRLLLENIELNNLQARVTACEGALSSAGGSGRLYLNPDNLGDHQLHEEVPGREQVAVRLERGSDWFTGRESRLDLVKIDVQGHEYEVLLGLQPLLRASGGGLRILLELSPRSLRAAGSSGRELIESLANLRLPFHIVDHIEHRLVACDAEDLAGWCDNVDSYPDDAGFMNIFLGQGV
jgi:FkbM family methyltransferase